MRNQSFVSKGHAEVSELKEQHSSVSQFQAQLLEKKAQLEEELSAVNQALDRTTTKLQITNLELTAQKQEMTTAIQLFPSLKNRASIAKERFKHCIDFWDNLWLHVFDFL